MRTVDPRKYIVELESDEKRHASGRYNHALEIDWLNMGTDSWTATLDSGYDDDVHVFTERDMLIVMSRNKRMEYVGIQVFNVLTGEETASAFISSDAAEPFLKLAPINAAKRLLG